MDAQDRPASAAQTAPRKSQSKTALICNWICVALLTLYTISITANGLMLWANSGGGGGISWRGGGEPETHYTILNIPVNATDAEIRSAYRRQVRLHHPDKLPAADRERATEALERVHAARDVLLSSARCAYDRFGLGVGRGATTAAQFRRCRAAAEQRRRDERQRELRKREAEAEREAERLLADLERAREEAREREERQRKERQTPWELSCELAGSLFRAWKKSLAARVESIAGRIAWFWLELPCKLNPAACGGEEGKEAREEWKVLYDF